MSSTFRGYVVDQKDGKYSGGFRDLTVADLPDYDVLVDVDYSSLNYKDGLAVKGARPIARSFPMLCGLDLAGTVAESKSPAFKPGDHVVATGGGGLSETMWGGYAAKTRVKPEVLVKLPKGFTSKQAMAIGTAGYTAMLAIMDLEHAGVTPDKGEVLVTGAAGGAGSVAVAVLAKLGYRVVASTGRESTHDYLKQLGASAVIARSELDRVSKPLEAQRWAGVVDTVGSKTLVTALAQTKEGGVVTAFGLAGGPDLPGTVMPFILRAVKLIGVYYNAPTLKAWREGAWDRLNRDLDKTLLDSLTVEEPLSRIEALADQILKGETRGRTVINVNK